MGAARYRARGKGRGLALARGGVPQKESPDSSGGRPLSTVGVGVEKGEKKHEKEEVLAEAPLARERRAEEEVLEEVASLIELAIRRSRASTVADPELESLIPGRRQGRARTPQEYYGREGGSARSVPAGRKGSVGGRESETGGRAFGMVPLRESNA